MSNLGMKLIITISNYYALIMSRVCHLLVTSLKRLVRREQFTAVKDQNGEP